MSFAFTPDEMNSMTAEQKAAVIGACIATVAADGVIDDDEIAKFDAEFQKVPWGLERADIEATIKRVYLEVKAVASADAAKALIARTAEAMPSLAIKEKALALAAKVAYVHGGVNRETANVLDGLAVAMQISLERMAEISAEVKAEAAPV